MTEEGYTLDGVVRNPWPEWERLEDGSWQRTWVIVFLDPSPPTPEVEINLSSDDLEVSLTMDVSQRELTLTTSTRGNAHADEIFFLATFELFERIEHHFGKIETIEGQPRDQWRPFRRIV